jgi:uncharacterized NAD(P)/FAD-binding protein YdhS
VKPHRVAILGFGFSGLMVVANLVRCATRPLDIYIIDPNVTGLGIAYGTTHRGHVLNVPAGRMGAFADDVGGFHAWLHTQPDHRHFTQADFVPRAIYGQYLQSIWRDAQAMAAQKKLHLKLVAASATQVSAGDGLAVRTERGDHIAVDAAVLATGHEMQPILPLFPSKNIIQNPWAADALAAAKKWPSPVVLMGSGLTAIDVMLSLRAAGYAGDVVMLSRHGLLPQPHAPMREPYAFDGAAWRAHPSLTRWMRDLRRAATTHEWRAVVDALRPHTPLLWQLLTTRDQQRFMRRLMAFWNVHRHRMAPEIAAQVQAEIAAGTLRVIKNKHIAALMENHPLTPDHAVINCTGPAMNVAKSAKPLLQQALADGMIEQHATYAGVAVDPEYRAWGAAYPHLSVVGPLMTGQFLESAAVPELRVQAAAIAGRIAALQ